MFARDIGRWLVLENTEETRCVFGEWNEDEVICPEGRFMRDSTWKPSPAREGQIANCVEALALV
jgi:hypothetical protein